MAAISRRTVLWSGAAAALLHCNKWKDYYAARESTPPRPLLLEALRFFEHDGRPVRRALDIGCGSGVETLYLLKQGAEVFAFDIEKTAIEQLREKTPPELRPKLHEQVASFSTAAWPVEVDLAFAGFSLPFAAPHEFSFMWSSVRRSLAVGARFAGQFFGKRDAWASEPTMTFHTRHEIEELLDGLEIEVLREVEENRATTEGTRKHWHIFEAIALKRR